MSMNPMALINPKFRKFFLGTIFAGIHTALFLLIALLVAMSGDAEAGMAYYIFYFIDYPVSRLLHFGSGIGIFVIGGGALWFLYGFAIQALLSIRSIKGLVPLGTAVLGIALMFSLPEISLVSMPEWEEHWERGKEASNANNLDLAIEHVSKAADMAPADEPLLDGIWDYLGRLYMDRDSYEQAETAFLKALAVVSDRQASRPNDFLNCHNQLSWFYERTKNIDKQKHHLKEAIRYNRMVYKGDSTQEAHCWHDLAEIAYARGDIQDAFGLQTKAIEMESHGHRGTGFLLNYLREQLAEWKTEQGRGTNPLPRAAHD